MWSGELRAGGEVIVDLGTTGAWLLESRTDGVVGQEGPRERRVSLQPVAYAPDGPLLVGGPARQRLAAAPASGVSEWLDRIGDDVPIVLDGRTVTPQDLLARVLRTQLGDAVAALRLVVPATWGPYRRGLVHDALRRVGLSSVRFVAAPLATLQAPGLELPATGRILVVDAGDRRTSAALVDLDGPGGPQLDRVAAADLGGSDIDEALLEFVRPRLAGPVTDADALLLACRNARERLSLAPAAELHVPGAEPLRLVRAELDALIGDRLRSTITALLERMGDVPADAVVLAGGLARMPLLVETVSVLVDRPVQVPADPGLAAVRGAARIAGPPMGEQAEPTPPAVLTAVPNAHDEAEARVGTLRGRQAEVQPDSQAEPTSPARGLFVPLRRYGGLASAAAIVVVVLSTPLAFPGFNLALTPGQSQGQSAGSVIAESRSAADRASTGTGQSAADTRQGPLRIVADLLTPGSAAGHEGTPRQASAEESSGPLRALADRLGVATPSGRPSTSSRGADQSATSTAGKSTGRSTAGGAQAPTNPAATQQAAETSSDQPSQPASKPEPTTAPPTQTTRPAPVPSTVPPTTAPPAPKPDPATVPPTTAPPAPKPDPAPVPPTTAPPAPATVPSDPAPATGPAQAPVSPATSSAPAPGPTSEMLDAGAV